jgi:hypothetical protein
MKKRRILSLLLTVAMVFSIAPASLMSVNAVVEPELVWAPDFTGRTVTGNNIGGDLGIQKGNPNDSDVEFVDGALHLTNIATDATNNKVIRIHTSAVTGADFGWSETTSFNPQIGDDYMITFDVASAESGGSVRIQSRLGSSTAITSQNVDNLTTTPQTVTHTWTQEGGESINIDTRNTRVGVALIISNIRIYNIPPTPCPHCADIECQDNGCLCDCGICSFCVHIFEFPLETRRAQIWVAGRQEGWDDGQFESPTGDAATLVERRAERENADIRFFVVEFNEAPDDWRFTIQNSTWRRYDINFLGDARSDPHGQILDNGTIRYVVDFDNDMPPVEEMGHWTAQLGEHFIPHPGYDRTVAHALFQVLLDANPSGEYPGSTFDELLSKINRAYFTNVHPNDHVFVNETLVQSWTSGPVTADTTGRDELKLYFSYTSSNLSGVRVQYSIDGGSVWNNMQSRISVFDTTGENSSRNDVMIILPRETYDQANLQIRWVPHGSDWNSWGNSTFTLSSIRLVSGLQAGERARRPSPVLSIGSVSVPAAVSTMVQRSRSAELTAPGVTLREDALSDVTSDVLWLTLEPDIARAANGQVRALGVGTATIRVAAIGDTSVYTEFNVTVTPATLNPNIMYTITSPYDSVNWDTFTQFKASHHTHSHVSDGEESTDSVAERHYELGYSAVAFTDHNRTSLAPHLNFQQGGSPMNMVNTPPSLRRITQMHSGSGRGGNGMLFIPGTNEHSGLLFEAITQSPTSHHVNVYWSNIANESGEPIQMMIDRIADEGTGIAQLNHPGRYTGSLFPVPWEEAAFIANNPANYLPYSQLLRHPFFTSMEIINKFDTESQADRILWDHILSENMPDNIPVWGKSNDDSHFNMAVGFSYNLMIMPELTLSELRHSMQAGTFFAFSRVDRQYDIYPGTITPGNWDGNEPIVQPVLDLPTPVINSITTGVNSITIDAENYEFINWYADGVMIHDGPTLDLFEHQLSIYSYVRATVGHSDYGVLYTQPFGIEERGSERSLPTLESVSNPNFDGNVTLRPGVPVTELGILLPGGTSITTTDGIVRPATVVWNLNNIDYDPAIRYENDHTFTVSGQVRLFDGLNGVRNPNNVSLNVSTQVTISAYVCLYCEPVFTPIWEMDFTGLTIDGSNIGGSFGMQHAAISDSTVQIIGNELHLTNMATDGTNNKAVRLHSAPSSAGEAAGWSEETGFVSEIGQEYRVTFMASVESGIGRIRMQNRTVDDRDRISLNINGLTPEPRLAEFLWTQVELETLSFDTGNTPVGVAVIISDIKIYEVFRCQLMTCQAPPCDCGRCGCDECIADVNCKECGCRLCYNLGICKECGCEICFAGGKCNECGCESCYALDGRCESDNCRSCNPYCDGDCGEFPCICCEECDAYPCACIFSCDCGSCAECDPPCPENCQCENCVVISAILRGDANGDGIVDISDALEILKYLAELNNLIENNPENYSAADVDEDGEITIQDALEILKYLAELPNLVEP